MTNTEQPPKSLRDLMREKLQALPSCDLRRAFADWPQASVNAEIMRLTREGVIESVRVSTEITPDDLVFEGERHYKKAKSK